MENKRQVSGSSSSSSSSLDHIFGPKVSSSSPSSSTGLFGTIFPPPSVVLGVGRDSTHSGIRGSWNYQGLAHHDRYGIPDQTTDYSKGQSSGTRTKDKTSSIYHNETVEPCYLSSSIYYGGQENYSPRTDSPQYFKKDGGDDDPNGNNSSGGASRGNWWKGSLYY
ncbi:hypothetical protein like AT2G39855 [Hibiscus trionum]|uniref:Uncharacterized protein n=1 Tax=Hibiscus trionum TaxID=183268 RepID=A0A9W7H256_HIBTR|nr:hypothetical protein like AT2G39855 [Hibiscus trionum]